jgi:hypothetical protein
MQSMHCQGLTLLSHLLKKFALSLGVAPSQKGLNLRGLRAVQCPQWSKWARIPLLSTNKKTLINFNQENMTEDNPTLAELACDYLDAYAAYSEAAQKLKSLGDKLNYARTLMSNKIDKDKSAERSRFIEDIYTEMENEQIII